MLRRALALLALALALVAPSGCGATYLGHATIGQVRILLGRVSIEDRLEDASVSAREKDRLRFVLDVRKFATGDLGLTDSGSFRSVYDTQGGPAVWNLSACRDDAFIPFVWSFPVVGAIPYKGWFDRRDADEEAKELRASDHDVLIYGAAAYSTLGWFSDPLFTAMLEGSDEGLADTIIHELTHATVYIAGDSDFNESLATWVGGEGSRAYFRARGGEKDPRLAEAEDEEHDEQIFDVEIKDLRARLQTVYASDLSRPEKLAFKRAIFDHFRVRYLTDVRPRLRAGDYGLRDLSNAYVLAHTRYHADLGAFDRLHRKLGSDLRRTLAALKKVAESDEPRAALEAASR